jgi:hypothetical protein
VRWQRKGVVQRHRIYDSTEGKRGDTQDGVYDLTRDELVLYTHIFTATRRHVLLARFEAYAWAPQGLAYLLHDNDVQSDNDASDGGEGGEGEEGDGEREEKETKEKETKEKRERREKRGKKGEKSDGDAEDFNLAEAVLRLVKLQRPQPKDGIGLEVETVALGGKSSGTSGLAITSVTIPPHVIEKLLFYGLPDNEPAEVCPGNRLLAVNGTIACNRPVLHVRGLLDTATLAASAHAAHTKRSGVCI